jgi:diguanylate cyclase (GGDEF)-like protein
MIYDMSSSGMNMAAANLLMTENNPEDMKLMEGALKDQGYRLFGAGTGGDAVRILAEEEIQIILLSTCLPDIDGYELCRQIRRSHRDTPLQILLLSPVRAELEIHKSVEVGSDDFLKKPFDWNELQARVRAAYMRWQNQANLLKEREFYRIAVAEEERLSSLVLDQNRSLKEAYEKIRKLNEELEKANKELEQIAAYDSLSGLLNRRSLFHRIAIEIDRAIRLEVPLTGLMVDIDHFKEINDNFGHQCGDNVIREIGVRLQGGLRKYDYAGRYGGEEFFVVLSNSTETQASRIAERFRKEMEDWRFTYNTEEIHVTVSIGIASYRPGESQENWIERADRAMYQAKQAGRNRIMSV